MLRRRLILMLAMGLLAACTPGGGDQGRLTRRFDAAGVTQVVLRASGVDVARVEPGDEEGRITVSGRATGGAEGYHPADPSWRETPAPEWGLDFVARRFGPTLVVSTRNEIGYIHHRYTIADIILRLPPGVSLVRQQRRLSGSGEADLAPP